MDLLLIANPILAEADHRWIERLRNRHDPQSSLVPAHFTLVFPVDEIDEDTLIAHATAVAERSRPVAFCLRRALAFHDPSSRKSYVFLVPGEGFSALTELHDRLYTGPLASALKRDIPFIPHITIGAFRTKAAAEKAVATLMARPIALPGAIDSLRVVRHHGKAVSTVARIALAD